MIDLTDFRAGLDRVTEIPGLVDEACKLIEGGNKGGGQGKFQEALVITSMTQGLLMLNLAKLAIEAGDTDLANSYSQLAYDALDTVGLKDHALGKTAAHLLAITARPQPARSSHANQKSRRRKR